MQVAAHEEQRATAPIGRLIRKIQRQPVVEARTPPSAGPSTDDVAHTVDNFAWILGRSFSGYMSAARVCTVPWMAPPPSPCTTRNAIRDPMSHAQAHSSDPIRNSTLPAIRTGLRPSESDSRPATRAA